MNQLLPLITAIHDQIDAAADPLHARHAARLRCAAGCSACCVDDLTVFTVEAARIVAAHRDLLTTGTPHPPGACAFLDADRRCRIYAVRPYVCRTQGLPLRWTDAGREHRDICPLNDDPADPITALPADACWPIGPAEAALGRLQDAVAPGQRVRLRDLFSASSAR